MSLVRMAERSKALRSGRSRVLPAWVRIPLLTTVLIKWKFSIVGPFQALWIALLCIGKAKHVNRWKEMTSGCHDLIALNWDFLQASSTSKRFWRGHPGSNRGPLDLQSNALPLSYTPNTSVLLDKYPCQLRVIVYGDRIILEMLALQ